MSTKYGYDCVENLDFSFELGDFGLPLSLPLAHHQLVVVLSPFLTIDFKSTSDSPWKIKKGLVCMPPLRDHLQNLIIQILAFIFPQIVRMMKLTDAFPSPINLQLFKFRANMLNNSPLYSPRQ